MITRRLLFLPVLLWLLAPLTAQANEPIVLTIPESIIAEAVSAALPLQVDATSATVQGDITIIDISELQLTEDYLACRLHLAGDDLQFVTEVAGHEIKLKVGAVEIAFSTKARLRYDQAKQTLFVRPEIDEVADSKDASGGDIGHALVALLNGREFPVDMQNLDPIIAKAGAKTLTINTTIADVKARKKRLQVLLAPTITSQ